MPGSRSSTSSGSDVPLPGFRVPLPPDPMFHFPGSGVPLPPTHAVDDEQAAEAGFAGARGSCSATQGAYHLDAVVRLLRDLVAIDSVNPTLVPGGAGEAGVADRIAAPLTAAGIDVEVTEVAPGRPNVVAVVEGREPGRTLMLCGHSDTVGVKGMTAPFESVLRDGRLYGRGSQDMKSGVAAMVDAATEIAVRGGLARGRLLVAAVADEEHASADAGRQRTSVSLSRPSPCGFAAVAITRSPSSSESRTAPPSGTRGRTRVRPVLPGRSTGRDPCRRAAREKAMESRTRAVDKRTTAAPDEHPRSDDLCRQDSELEEAIAANTEARRRKPRLLADRRPPTAGCPS